MHDHRRYQLMQVQDTVILLNYQEHVWQNKHNQKLVIFHIHRRNQDRVS